MLYKSQWDDEDSGNRSNKGGAHLLDTETKGHKIHFCYYYKNINVIIAQGNKLYLKY